MDKEMLVLNDKTPADNERFGGRRGVGSWDTLQVFESSPPVQAFVNPRPTAKPPGVSRHYGRNDSETETINTNILKYGFFDKYTI